MVETGGRIGPRRIAVIALGAAAVQRFGSRQTIETGF
jgi:hypothetical protein